MTVEGLPIADTQEVSLDVLRDLRARTESLYKLEATCLEDYVKTHQARTIIARSVNEGQLDADDPSHQDPLDQATCTSFAATHLADYLRAHPTIAGIVPTKGPDSRSFAGSHTHAVMTTIVSDFDQQYSLLHGKAAVPPEVRETKDVAALPNAYSTPMHLCGLAAAIEYLGGADKVKPHTVELALAFAAIIANRVLELGGLVYDVSFDHHRERPETPPNQYLSYWCARSLVTWSAFGTRLATDHGGAFRGLAEFTKVAETALSAILASSIDRLSRMVAAFHAGISSLHDAVDMVSALSTVGLVAKWLDKRDEFTNGLIGHALDLLMDGYVHSDGSFAPKSTVLTSRGGYNIVASSVELAAILLHGVASEISPHEAVALQRVLGNVARRRSGPRGWGSDAGTSSLRRPAFAASGALAFLRDYNAILDHHVAMHCATKLGVKPHAPESEIDLFVFPTSVRDSILSRVVTPIRDQQRRDLAVMSFVLGGPPGTAKTTIAKKIASELKWPILLLDQGSFLRQGAGQVESEAERIFDLLLELSDTVVLFDEIEEMVEDRDTGEKSGRFLTTSMLPRIHRLRDKDRVLFIIATNYPERIDAAASRPGRIDEIFRVEPPDKDERQRIIDRLFDVFQAPGDLRLLFKESEVAGQTGDFTYGYLRELVKSCVNHAWTHDEITKDAVSNAVKAMRARLRNEYSDDGGKRR